MMNTNQQKVDLRSYRTFGLPLLGLMGVIALLGVVLTAAVHFIF